MARPLPPERPTADANTRGDFLCDHILEIASPHGYGDAFPTWSLFNNHAMLSQGLPAASMPPVPPSVAAISGSHPRQARPDTLLREPFADYNVVTPAAAVKFPTRNAPTSFPVKGRLSSIFEPVNTIGWDEGGDWVRDFIRNNPSLASRSPSGSRQVTWSDEQLLEQFLLWFDSARADMEAFHTHGKSHRPKTKTFIIPARCHKGGGLITWDLRPWWEALEKGLPTDNIQVRPTNRHRSNPS